MTTQIKRKVFDFLAKNYTSKYPGVQLLSVNPDPVIGKEAYPALKGEEFIQRWYLSLQGEDHPVVTTGAKESGAEQRLVRYDWAFGITVVNGYYWDWVDALCEEGSLAIHIVLEPTGGAPDPIPVSATLSALHPSRNTKSVWERAWPKIPKTAAEMAKMGASTFPALDYISSGLMLGSNLLESYAENQKNWFLYQFLDEQRRCPVIEWRINKKVLKEYGPLLRGTLFLDFCGSTEFNTDCVRILLRPQIRYCPEGDLCYIIPTNALAEDQLVFIDVHPKKEKERSIQ